jgi:hypothetical protein
MKNSIKWIEIVALIAVIGFSFAACGEGPEGPKGETGPQGPATGGMLPYIPAESGLLGTVWDQDIDPPHTGVKLTFSSDGYTLNRVAEICTVTGYGKRPDGSHVVTFFHYTYSEFLTVSGNTIRYEGSTYTKQ